MSDTSLIGKMEGSAELDYSILKLFSYVGLTVLSAFLAGYFIASIDSQGVLYSLVTLFVFWALFSLQVFFIKDKVRNIVAISLEALAMFLPVAVIFKDNLSITFFWAFLVLFIMLFWASLGGRGELANSLRVHFWRVARATLMRAIPAVLAFITISFVLMSGKNTAEASGAVISSYFLAPTINVYLPDFRPEMSIRDLIVLSAKKQLGEEKFNSLSASDRELTIQRTEAMIQSYTGEINTAAPVGEAIYNFFADRLKDSTNTAKVIIGIMIFSFAWFVIKAMTMIFFLPIALFAVVLYEILIVTNFSTLQYESRSKEIVLLK